MPSAAEIAYREAVRALEGQANDLENIRSHVNVTLSAGGIAAAFLGSQAAGHGVAFWIAVVAFAGVAAVAIRVYWPVEFAWDFNGYELVSSYVDSDPPMSDDAVMRDLAVHATDDHAANRECLEKLYNRQSLALMLFGVEVIALLIHLVAE